MAKKDKTTSVYRLRRLCAQCMISNNNYINDGVFGVIFFKTMCNKTIIRFCFCNILNNQGIGKCYQPRPSARLITVTSSLIIPDITKPHPIMVYLLVHAHFGLWFELVVKVRRFDVSRLYFEGNDLQRLNIISFSSTSIFFSVQLFKAEQVREVLG